MQTRQAADAKTDTAASLLFGGHESACGWYDSSFELRAGLAVSELSDRELMKLWLELRSAATAPAVH